MNNQIELSLMMRINKNDNNDDNSNLLTGQQVIYTRNLFRNNISLRRSFQGAKSSMS